jgi:Protein of unknown function (DUF3037)
MNYFDYSIIRYMPDSRRGEVVNIGVLVYRDKRVETHWLSNLAKARQLDASLSIKDLDELPKAFNSIAKSAPSAGQMYSLMADMGAIKLSEPAYFAADADADYQARIREIMQDLVTPKAKAQAQRPHGRLISALKKQFQKNHLLAEIGEGITENHLVAVGYPISEESGLTVDFAQKNGRWNVTQTIDYKIKKENLTGKFKEVGIKAIGLDQASKQFGNDTARFCIIDVPDEYQNIVQGQINILSEYSDHVLYYNSREDMGFYWQNAFKAANIGMTDA